MVRSGDENLFGDVRWYYSFLLNV